MSGERSPAHKASAEQELAVSQRRMRAAILKLHGQMGTGIGEAELEGLQAFLTEINEIVSAAEPQSLDAKIRAALCRKAFEECGPLAWDCLNKLMERSDLQWCDPGGLLPNSSPEERAQAREHRLGEVKELFLKQSMGSGLKLIVGVVGAWKSYPVEDCWLWKEVALRAAATGMRALLLKTAMSRARQDSVQLRTKAEEILAEGLQKVHQLLDHGVQSLEDADRMVSSSMTIIDEVLPGLAWQHVEQLVLAKAAELSKKQ